MFKEIGLNSLGDLWRKENPAESYGVDTAAKVLFDYYMHLDYKDLLENPEDLGDAYDFHSHSLDIVRLGLGSGAIDYKRAREFLYDAIESRDGRKLLLIYLDWFDVLKNYGENSLESWGDAQTLKRKTLEEIDRIKNPAGRASYTASLTHNAGDFMKPEEAKSLIESSAVSLLKKLPPFADFARTASRKEDTGTLSFTVAFVRQANEMGYKEEVKEITKYLTDVMSYYDPATGSIYDTGALMHFTASADVPKVFRNYFKERVKRALPTLERGLFGKDALLARLAILNLRVGNIKTAYTQLGRIKEELNFLHTVKAFMVERPEDIPQIDAMFDGKFLPLIAKSRGRKLEDLKARGLNHEKRRWTLYKVLAGKDLAKKNDYRIFGQRDVINAILAGEFDSLLYRLADFVDIKKPQSMVLRFALIDRISRILRTYDSETEHGQTKNAVEALLTLKNKSALL